MTSLQMHFSFSHKIQQNLHPPMVDNNPRPAARVDKRPRPEAPPEMSEHDWRFFLSEWAAYKWVTGVKDRTMLDELWSCMTVDLRCLAFDQGDMDSLNTEGQMLTRIKTLAVSVLHEAVHTVALHDAKQAVGESTKAFAARVRGIASNCNLAKDCTCGQKVSFLEETVYHAVLAGLGDQEMQERCTSAAILKTITDITSLVEFCSAEESGKMSAPTTVGALSTYKKVGKGRSGRVKPTQPTTAPQQKGRCGYCSGSAHKDSSWETKEKECRAYNLTCNTCGRQSHLSTCCRSKTRDAGVVTQGAPANPEEGSNAALEFSFYAIQQGTGLETTHSDTIRQQTKAEPKIWHPQLDTNLEATTSGISGHRATARQDEQFLLATSGPVTSFTIPACNLEYECRDGRWGWWETSPRPSPAL